MANYVGRSPVFLPYYHYHTPAESYPVAVKAGAIRPAAQTRFSRIAENC